MTARRGARSAGLLGGVGWSGVLNVARGVRDRGTSRPCVGGFSSMPREPSRAEPVSPVVDRCGSSICEIEAVLRRRRGEVVTSLPGSMTVRYPRRSVVRVPPKETSPSPVYGAALLMRLRFYRLSRVRIPESPLSRDFQRTGRELRTCGSRPGCWALGCGRPGLASRPPGRALASPRPAGLEALTSACRPSSRSPGRASANPALTTTVDDRRGTGDLGRSLFRRERDIAGPRGDRIRVSLPPGTPHNGWSMISPAPDRIGAVATRLIYKGSHTAWSRDRTMRGSGIVGAKGADMSLRRLLVARSVGGV